MACITKGIYMLKFKALLFVGLAGFSFAQAAEQSSEADQKEETKELVWQWFQAALSEDLSKIEEANRKTQEAGITLEPGGTQVISVREYFAQEKK